MFINFLKFSQDYAQIPITCTDPIICAVWKFLINFQIYIPYNLKNEGCNINKTGVQNRKPMPNLSACTTYNVYACYIF